MAREVNLGDIRGPQGQKGETGLTGPEGKQGPKGEKGDPGATIATGVSYGDSNVGAALDNLSDKVADLIYDPIAITSMGVDPRAAEMGSTVNTVVLTWQYNKVPVSATLDGAALDVALRTKTIENANLKANKTYTIKARDDREAESSKSATVYFWNGVYYGVGTASGDAIDKAFIAGLTKALATVREREITVNAAAGQYIYYAIPTRFGTPSFFVGGFEGGFNKVKTFRYENPSGYAESYDVWRTTNTGLGSTKVTIK